MLNIGRGNFEPKQHTVICSEHFRPECFSAFGNRKNLKHNAVPTVFAFQDAAQVNTPVSLSSQPAGAGRTFAGSVEVKAEPYSEGSAINPPGLEASLPRWPRPSF